MKTYSRELFASAFLLYLSARMVQGLSQGRYEAASERVATAVLVLLMLCGLCMLWIKPRDAWLKKNIGAILVAAVGLNFSVLLLYKLSQGRYESTFDMVVLAGIVLFTLGLIVKLMISFRAR